MEHREDALLCQQLLRAGTVDVETLGRLADRQRELRSAAAPVPRLGELLVAEGHLTPRQLEAALELARGQGPRRRRRRKHESSRWGRSSSQLAALERGPGDQLGPYLIEELLARGACGQVFRARCQRSGQAVALKALSPERGDDEQAVSRFIKEARLACSLDHPSLVRGRSFGLDSGTRYLVLDLVEGRPLDRLLTQSGPASPGETARLGARVAQALAYLHERGVVHRDVKPANILVGPGSEPGSVRLCDLGLARELEVPSAATASGTALGTPRYMAPEQARGERDVGPAADLYALGVTLFHAVAGRPPFPEESGLVALSRHLFDEVPDVRSASPDVSPALAAVLWRLTRKEPSRRYPSARSAAIALSALATAAEAPRPAAPEPLRQVA